MKRGFSIIELIIGCLIIGVIASVGLNAYIGLRDKAIVKTAEARLHQLNVAKQQFIAEYGRLEAESMWGNPPNNLIAGQADNTSERRYNLLKRYIERPQATLSEFLPLGCTIGAAGTPSSVHGTYTATDTRATDPDKKTITAAP